MKSNEIQYSSELDSMDEINGKTYKTHAAFAALKCSKYEINHKTTQGITGNLCRRKKVQQYVFQQSFIECFAEISFLHSPLLSRIRQ